MHPYVGGSQGLEHSLLSCVRHVLALKTIGPVILTEFGQYCCGAKGKSCRGSGLCSNAAQGAHFVHNVVNMAEQYDISWVGWAWRGTNVNNANAPCLDGMAECGQPDIRDMDNATGTAVLTDGKRGGADWRSTWARFVAPPGGDVTVQDEGPDNLGPMDRHPRGFLPRPCIVGTFNMGNMCGWDGGAKLSASDAFVFANQTVFGRTTEHQA